MDEIEKRINQNEKDIALVAQRIDIHQEECMEKHEAVLDELKFSRRWTLGILASILLLLLGVLLK